LRPERQRHPRRQHHQGDDQTIRRQANRAGVYVRPAPFTFPASTLKQGANTLTLQGSGIMYDTVVLEAD